MMTTEEQIIAVAEFNGWKREAFGAERWLSPCGNWVRIEQLPAYDKDLNAIHGALMALSDNKRDLVNLKLMEITAGHFDHSEIHDIDAAINAEAPQRLEALCRTLWPERWKE